MAKKDEQPSYDAAIEELETILDEIEGEAIGIDALAQKIERAAALLVRCRGLLRATELRVEEALKALAAPEEEAP